MAKGKAVYEPGELSRVRGKLGALDAGEAKRMAQLLGGEVGREKTPEFKAPPPRPAARRQPREEKVEMVVGANRGSTGLPRGRRRSPDSTSMDDDWAAQGRGGKGSAADNVPAVGKLSYWERLKMDRQAALPEFDIKSSGQALFSMLSFFSTPVDFVNPVFVTKRMSEYYKRLETLVTSTRTLLPSGSPRRLETLKKKAPLAYLILETIRVWNIDKVAGDLAKLQAQPRNILASEFADLLKVIYRPLFIMEQLDTEIHIKGAFKVLYKLLYLENPEAARDKYQEMIRTALIAYNAVRRDVHYLLYPLLMRLISGRWFSYENFFKEQRQRFLAFINAGSADQIVPTDQDAHMDSNVDLRDNEAGEEEGEGDAPEENPEEDENDPAVITRKAEMKAVGRGLDTLEILFPQAGWDRITESPDLYPYFGKMFDLTRGYEQISPLDPLHQMVVLMRILEELFFGLRYVSFGSEAPGLEDAEDRVDETMTELINNWHSYLEICYYKEYLHRVREYVRILEGSVESRNSSYAKRLLNELHWTKRLFFLPYYKFESLYPPPFQKKEITSIYPEIRKLRKYLTAVAAGIEQGIKAGGMEKKALCPGINNPWDTYEFQVPNPLSERLDVLLPGKSKNNASLIFYTLAVSTTLDYLVNNENSWAYDRDRPAPLFRSIEEPGNRSSSGEPVDADALFHQSIKSPAAGADDFVPEPLPEEPGQPSAASTPAESAPEAAEQGPTPEQGTGEDPAGEGAVQP